MSILNKDVSLNTGQLLKGGLIAAFLIFFSGFLFGGGSPVELLGATRGCSKPLVNGLEQAKGFARFHVYYSERNLTQLIAMNDSFSTQQTEEHLVMHDVGIFFRNKHSEEQKVRVVVSECGQIMSYKKV